MRTQGSRRKRAGRWWLIGLLVAAGVVANVIVWFRPFGWPPARVRYEYPTYSAAQVAAGEALYRVTCSACHGPAGEGDAAAEVPALDGSMHAWHHADSLFARYIREGGVYMPAVAPEWSDEQVTAVLAYVKQWWEPRQGAYQHEVSEANPATP